VPSAEKLAVIEGEGLRILEFARRDPDRPVPQYPGWTMTDLVRHVASIHARTIEICRTLPVDRIPAPAPPSGADVIDWYAATLPALVAALSAADYESPAWGFGTNGKLGFWENRMLIETGIHRWDAQQAFEDPDPLLVPVATAGMEEFPEMWMPRLGDELPAVEFVAEDVAGTWVFGVGPVTFSVNGPVSDIFLRLMARPGIELPAPWAEAVDGLATPAG
jgi:uncharacterized protein (TIGR03083 family)